MKVLQKILFKLEYNCYLPITLFLSNLPNAFVECSTNGLLDLLFKVIVFLFFGNKAETGSKLVLILISLLLNEEYSLFIFHISYYLITYLDIH